MAQVPRRIANPPGRLADPGVDLASRGGVQEALPRRLCVCRGAGGSGLAQQRLGERQIVAQHSRKAEPREMSALPNPVDCGAMPSPKNGEIEQLPQARPRRAMAPVDDLAMDDVVRDAPIRPGDQGDAPSDPDLRRLCQIEAGLSCGNINRDPAARILYAGLANFHVRLAKEFGWGVLYALIAREAPELADELPSIENADSVCEICRDLHLQLAEQLAPYQQAIEREYARARATREWQRTGGSESRAIAGGEVTLDELLARMDTDRALRLDYLAGFLQLGDDLPAEPLRKDPNLVRTASFA